MTLFILDLEEIKSYSFHFALDYMFYLIQTRIFCTEHTLSTSKEWGFVHNLKVLYGADPGKRHMFWGWKKRKLCQLKFLFLSVCYVFANLLRQWEVSWMIEAPCALLPHLLLFQNKYIISINRHRKSLIWFICIFPGIWSKK